MAIILPPVAFFTKDDRTTVDVDNRPLYNLVDRDIALKNAIQDIKQTKFMETAAGEWTSIQINIPITAYKNVPFSLMVNVWAVQDIDPKTSETTVIEEVVLGSIDPHGVISLSKQTEIGRVGKAAPYTFFAQYSSGIEVISVNFIGYSGSNGFVRLRAELFTITG